MSKRVSDVPQNDAVELPLETKPMIAGPAVEQFILGRLAELPSKQRPAVKMAILEARRSAPQQQPHEHWIAAYANAIDTAIDK